MAIDSLGGRVSIFERNVRLHQVKGDEDLDVRSLSIQDKKKRKKVSFRTRASNALRMRRNEVKIDL